MKRDFDIVFSLISLIILAFPILLIALLVRLTLGAPVLFNQSRPGLHSGPFTCYKFRTMLDLRDKDGRLLPDEKRMTVFGKFMRKYSLDELPQLWNVLKGDMSFVGPRPLLMEYLNLYTKKQARRHEMRPGITGWAQVNGRNAISWEDKLNLDIWYVDNQSFWLDLKIIWLTIVKVIKSDGVSQRGHVTIEKFKGQM